MRRLVRGTCIFMALAGVAVSAEANQGFFGGRMPQDGSINMRKSTMEQFNPIRGESVAARARPDFDPTPIDMGSFQLFPAVNVAGYFDSNIYSRKVATHQDFVTKINPSLSAASNWGRHAIAFTGVGDIVAYKNTGDENYVGGFTQAEGRYDIAEQTWLAGTLGYQRVTEPRSSPSVAGAAAEPTQYNLYKASAHAYRGVGVVKAKADYNFSLYEFGLQKIVPAGTINLNTRDRVDNKIGGEVSYEVSPNFIPFVNGFYDWRNYSITTLRDSTGYATNVGARMDFGGVVTGEAYIGYIARDYHNFGRRTDGVNLGGNVLWNVTELTSVQGEFDRTIEETNIAGSTGSVATGGSLTVTHELRRDLVIEANASYTNFDYQSIARNDDQIDASFGGRYYLNRNFYTDATYEFVNRSSNVAAAGYDRHIGLLRFGAQY